MDPILNFWQNICLIIQEQLPETVVKLYVKTMELLGLRRLKCVVSIPLISALAGLAEHLNGQRILAVDIGIE
jgi:hypothetical protein